MIRTAAFVTLVALAALAAPAAFDIETIPSAEAGKCLTPYPQWDDMVQPDGKQCIAWVPLGP